MRPPRAFPPGVVQLIEVKDDEKTLVSELPSRPSNRMRLQELRNMLLLADPTRNLVLSENNAWK